MESVLFIDNDKATLNAVVRNFKVNDYDFNLITLENPELGFQEILKNDVKAVIADISLDGFLCKTFYEEMRAVKPSIIRISLTDDQSLMESFNDDGQTHITFGKPINTSHFLDWLSKLIQYRKNASEELISRFFEHVKLKSYPENILNIIRMLNDKNFQMHELVQCINNDTNLKAKLLKFVNSSAFGFARQVSDIQEAVEYLGVNNINSVVKFLNVFSIFEKQTTQSEVHKAIDFLFDKKFISQSNFLDLKFAENLKGFVTSDKGEYTEQEINCTTAHIMHVMMINEEICDALSYIDNLEECDSENELLTSIALINYLIGNNSFKEYLSSKVGDKKLTDLQKGFST